MLALNKTEHNNCIYLTLYNTEKLEEYLKDKYIRKIKPKLITKQVVLGYIDIQKTKKLNVFKTNIVVAQDKKGPFMYNVAFNVIGNNGWLMSDRQLINKQARKIWSYFYEIRNKEFEIKEAEYRFEDRNNLGKDIALTKQYRMKEIPSLLSKTYDELTKNNQTLIDNWQPIISEKIPDIIENFGSKLFTCLYRGPSN